MNEEKKFVPRLRFEEFENTTWKPFKLKNIVRFSKGRGYSKNDLQKSGTPIILYGRMYTNYEMIISNVNTFVSPIENSVYSNGTEVIVPSSGETAEDIARASFVSKKGIILAGDLNIIHVTENHNPLFLALSISNGKRKKELIKRAQGTSVVHLYNTDLEEATVYFPILSEQEKIGDFLKTLDGKIQLQQTKINKVKDIKSAYLSEMFPKEGEKYPKRRFEGFTEPWTEEYLGNLSNITTGALDANAMNPKGKYDFYTSGIKKYKIDTPAFEGPAITIAGNGATVGYMHLADGSFNAYQRTYVLTQFHASREFLYLEIGRKLPIKIKQEARMGNIPYIVMDMLVDLTIHLPSLKEQQKIGEFFKNLDTQISIEEEKLAKLEKLKQAYLNGMFV